MEMMRVDDELKIPKGFRRSAQGCEERATLGDRLRLVRLHTAALRKIDATRFGVVDDLNVDPR